MTESSLFNSFFMAGFECSTHRRRDGRRLDLLAATQHDRFVEQDYRQALAHGLRTARDGLRWHLIETSPGRYDWSSFLPALRSARDLGVQVVWDLCHYGYPDGLEIWDAAFVDRFARFAEAAARIVRDETDTVPFFCPVNEISYWAWAGGDVAKFNPACRGRGPELKRQLVRASIAAIEALWRVDARARIVHADPIINIIAKPHRRQEIGAAARYHASQFEAWDMLSGRAWPELGGKPDYLDIVGVNFYPDNQWLVGGRTIPLGHHLYRPFREMLADVHRRYGRPVFVAETGAEGTARTAWLFYVAGEVRAAIGQGTPVHGVCLYPILDYPGWANERHCDVGLLCAVGSDQRRPVHQPLAEELHRQQGIFAALRDRDRQQLRLVGRTG
jgi:beta-glucosidase/6-phospho-beta-glucosidase/beta-galactosidase